MHKLILYICALSAVANSLFPSNQQTSIYLFIAIVILGTIIDQYAVTFSHYKLIRNLTKDGYEEVPMSVSVGPDYAQNTIIRLNAARAGLTRFHLNTAKTNIKWGLTAYKYPQENIAFIVDRLKRVQVYLKTSPPPSSP